MPLADPRLIERAGTLRDNGSSRHTGKDARHSKSSRLRPLASDTYPIAYEIVADFCREARYSLRTPRTASETIGHRLRLKYESKAGEKKKTKFEIRAAEEHQRRSYHELRAAEEHQRRSYLEEWSVGLQSREIPNFCSLSEREPYSSSVANKSRAESQQIAVRWLLY